LLPQLLPQDNVDVAAMRVEVTRMREVVAAMEAARAVSVLTAKASAWEAAMAWDGATLRIKDAEDRATPAEREALEWVSRAEADNSVELASARDDVEGLTQKIAVLESELAKERRARKMSEREHRDDFDVLTILQTRGSELCLAIIGPPRARHLSKGM
jgi:hypothetical protein